MAVLQPYRWRYKTAHLRVGCLHFLSIEHTERYQRAAIVLNKNEHGLLLRFSKSRCESTAHGTVALGLITTAFILATRAWLMATTLIS